MDMYIPIVDPNEALAENRNKKITLEQLFGAVTGFTGTLYTYGDGSEFGPWYFIFRGTSQSTFTLPAGSTSIIGMPIYFGNLGTAELLIQGAGTDPILPSDPFSIPSGDKQLYCARWMGATDGWIFK